MSSAESLRERCVAEALAIVDAEGVEGLSLREVARRLRVSHQAPYKHFASRDHLLAEIVSRAFQAFGAHLDARPRVRRSRAGVGHAAADLAAMGRAYLDYARLYPLQYRLMFGTPLPDPAAHPTMMASAQHAFAMLRDGLKRMHAEEGRVAGSNAIDRDALFVWAALHGMASIGHAPALERLGLSASLLAGAESHGLARIGDALADRRAGTAVGGTASREVAKAVASRRSVRRPRAG